MWVLWLAAVWLVKGRYRGEDHLSEAVRAVRASCSLVRRHASEVEKISPYLFSPLLQFWSNECLRVHERVATPSEAQRSISFVAEALQDLFAFLVAEIKNITPILSDRLIDFDYLDHLSPEGAALEAFLDSLYEFEERAGEACENLARIFPMKHIH